LIFQATTRFGKIQKVLDILHPLPHLLCFMSQNKPGIQAPTCYWGGKTVAFHGRTFSFNCLGSWMFIR